MNPYAPSVLVHKRRAKPQIAYFGGTSYLIYASGVIYNLGGPSKAFIQVSESPVGFLVESCIVLIASCIAGLIGGLCLQKELSENSVAVSRAVGGVTFGALLLTSQPYILLPLFAGLLIPLEATPFNMVAQFYRTMFTQPYIMIPTIIVAGVLACSVERLWRGHFAIQRIDEPIIAPESQ